MLRPDEIPAHIGARRAIMDDTSPTPDGKKLEHPAEKAPRIFADTGSIDEIMPLYEAGIVSGVTTNPTLMKRAGADSWEAAKKMMKEIVSLLDPYPVSLELTELTADKMLAQAEELAAYGAECCYKGPCRGI